MGITYTGIIGPTGVTGNAWGVWVNGGCGCPFAICSCASVPQNLHLTSTLYGNFVLRWSPIPGVFVSDPLIFNYPGSLACPSHCAAVAGIHLRYILWCPAGWRLDIQTISSSATCPNGVGTTWRTMASYARTSFSCPPLSIVNTLGVNSPMACGTGDTATVTV